MDSCVFCDVDIHDDENFGRTIKGIGCVEVVCASCEDARTFCERCTKPEDPDDEAFIVVSAGRGGGEYCPNCYDYLFGQALRA